MPALTVNAPAKLNLCLNVVGRRADGYHLLDSLFAFCGLADELHFGMANALSLQITGPWADAIEDRAYNLVLRAAELLRGHSGCRAGAAIHLDKRIPVAAGLGGGSADAAAALRGLNRFWSLNYTDDQLLGLAAQLGADTPACLASQPVHASGIGEVLGPLPPLPECGILLVNPRVPTPTPEVFRAFARENPFIAPRPLVELAAPFEDIRALVEALAPRGNDLLAAAVSVAPVIAKVLEDLKVLPGCRYAHLSGSGATCFGLFASAKDASEAGALLAQKQPSWWIWSGTWAIPDRQ